MSTLVLSLSGLQQAWGLRSLFLDRRDTGPMPTRSGIVGLLAACLGKRRDESLDWSSPLRMTTRVDREGSVHSDFQTVGAGRGDDLRMPNAEGKRLADGKVSRRLYLVDAAFVVALEGPDNLIGSLADAIRTPHFTPVLGRRNCPPGLPLLLGTTSQSGEALLRELPALVEASRGAAATVDPYNLSGDINPVTDDGQPQAAETKVRCLLRIEDGPYVSEQVNDMPVSFRADGREHDRRDVFDTFVNVEPAGVGLEGWQKQRDFLSSKKALQ